MISLVCSAFETHQRGRVVHVIAPGKLGIEPGAEIDEGLDAAFEGNPSPASGLMRPVEHLEDGRLPRTVPADQPKTLPRPGF